MITTNGIRLRLDFAIYQCSVQHISSPMGEFSDASRDSNIVMYEKKSHE